MCHFKENCPVISCRAWSYCSEYTVNYNEVYPNIFLSKVCILSSVAHFAVIVISPWVMTDDIPPWPLDLLWGIVITARFFPYSTYIFLSFQLYEIDDNPKRKVFLDELFQFMQNRGEHRPNEWQTCEWNLVSSIHLERQALRHNPAVPM